MRTRRLSLLLAPLMLLATTRPALAVDVEACVAQHEQAQVSRRDGKLLAARKALAVCLDPSCPAVIRKDCAELMEKNSSELASLVFRAEVNGAASMASNIKVDDEAVPSTLGPDGFEVDPGVHAVTATVGGERISESVIVRIGDKRRTVLLTAKKAPPPGDPAKEPATTQDGGSRVLPLVLGGVGVLGLVGFGAFGLRGLSMEGDLDGCKPNCDKGRVDDVRTSYLIGDVSLAVGVVALGAAAYFFLAGTKDTPKAAWLGPRGLTF